MTKVRDKRAGCLARRALMLAAAVVLASVVGLLTACGPTQTEVEAYDGTLDIGIAFPPSDWRSGFIQDFAAELERNSGGSLTTRIHYSDEYADMVDLLEEMEKGSHGLDIILAADAYLGDYSIPDFYVSGLPYLFEDFEDAWAFAESDINAKIEEKLPQYGMRVLSRFCGGFRSIAASKPIEQPSDLDDLVVATVKSPILMDMLSAFGANPQPSVASEFHDALAKGVYDAVEVSIPTFYRDKDYELLDNVAITNHAYNLWSLIVDEQVWQTLSPDEREIVKEAAEKYAALERVASKKVTEDLIVQLEEVGVSVIYPDPAPFQEATESVRKKYSSAYADTYEEVKAYLANRR